MDIYQSICSSASILEEQLSQEIFNIVPEDGLVVGIINQTGNCQFNDSEAFAALNVKEALLKELCERVDDGQEPALIRTGQNNIIVSQLAGEQGSYGYIFLALPQDNCELSAASFSLIEMLLNQVRLIVELLEKNQRLYDAQAKRYLRLENYQTASN
jgi:hypothetical protein